MQEARRPKWEGAWYTPHVLAILAVLGLGWGSRNEAVVSGSDRSGASSVAFDLEEISAFDVPEALRSRFLSGTFAECRTEPDKDIKRYPAFQSSQPLYGSFQLGSASTEPQAGYQYAFAVDESAGAGRGYDRFYLDANLNGDLTDDPCRTPMKNAPKKALLAISSAAAEVCFDTAAIRVTPDDDAQHRLEVMPRFLALKGDRRYAMLVSTKARTGKIRVGGIDLTAVLGHASGIPGWFDHPATGLFLYEGDSSKPWYAGRTYGGCVLKEMHRSGDIYYCFSATPNGDKLFVAPYQGRFGTLEIKSGGRNAHGVSATGSVGSKDAVIGLEQKLGNRTVQPSDSYRLPVGDYCPLLMNFTFDSTNCIVLRNIHADGRVQSRAQQDPAKYAIQIREDKPFVLDLSGKPEVLFASPAKDVRIVRGGTLEVKGVLIDPQLDIMFRSIRQSEQLDPKIVIQRAGGEIVAEGVMPFG